LIVAAFGDEANFMYGASSTRHRVQGAAVLLQFEAMRWARARGCARYDLWAIPDEDPTSAEGAADKLPGSRGEDLRGLYHFKVGFGGQIITYPPTAQRLYRPMLISVARRIPGLERRIS